MKVSKDFLLCFNNFFRYTLVEEENWDTVAAVEPPAIEVKLFGRWNPDEVQVGDISLQVSSMITKHTKTSITQDT